jgi:hypothetical protein
VAETLFINDLFRKFDKREQQTILQEAGLERERDIKLPAQVQLLIPPILRRMRVSNDQFRQLMAEAEFRPRAVEGSQQIDILIPYASSYSGVDLPVNELTAASLVVWELSLRVAETLYALDVPYALDPPAAKVAAGSVSFSIGGSPSLIAGIGLVVAAHTAVPPGTGADLAYWGGSLSISCGLFDMVVNWYKMIKDAKNADSETILNQAKARLTELEIQKAQRELRPASALVPAETVENASKLFVVDRPLAYHLINEVMPALLALSNSYPSPIKVSTGSSKARVASSSSSPGST